MKRISLATILPLLSAILVLAGRHDTQAQGTATLTTLYIFTGGTGSDGACPNALVQGPDGSFYGTAASGGTGGYGTVFKIAPDGTFMTLYSFTGGDDGAQPTAGLTLGRDGNFYGTTAGTIANMVFPAIVLPIPTPPSTGNLYGTVFQITPAGTLTTLHTFTGGDDGGLVFNGLTAGPDGNFYGTTNSGGAVGDYGTVFQITPGGTFTTLYSFPDGGIYGGDPGALALGSDGFLYGTTNNSVFKITPGGTFTTLYSVSDDGYDGPFGSLVQGSDGNFYGVTSPSSGGTVFQFTPAGALTTLHTFSGPDGSAPEGPLALGRDGNLYGATQVGGPGYQASTGYGGDGTLFQITPAGALTTLYDFDGAFFPSPGVLAQGSDGSFYGTTQDGGAYGAGTIFRLTVTAHPAFFTGQTPVGNGVYYLAFPDGSPFGFYSFLDEVNYLFHFDLGYEYVFDANDGQDGVYLYDFASRSFFYTSPTFPFPYLYDFKLGTVLYYYPDTNNLGRYTSNPRAFYNFATGQIITK